MSSTSSSSSPSDDDWDDWGASTNPNDAGDGAGDDDAAVSLFDGRVLPSAAAALAHDAAEHGFDLAAFRSKVCVCVCAREREREAEMDGSRGST